MYRARSNKQYAKSKLIDQERLMHRNIMQIILWLEQMHLNENIDKDNIEQHGLTCIQCL